MASIKKILLATDMSEAGSEATRAAINLANNEKAELSILFVATVPSFYSFGHKTYEEIAKELKEEAVPALEDYAKTHEVPSSAKLIVDIGSPKEMILENLKEEGSDLLVIGSHGQHGLSDHIGSTISAVLQKISTDVFIAHPKK